MQVIAIVITGVGFLASAFYIYEFVYKRKNRQSEEAKLHQVIEEAMRKQLENHKMLSFPSVETPNSKEKTELLIKAYSCLRDSQYTESIDSFVRCLASETDERQRIAFLISIANSYYSQGKLKEATDTYQDAFNLAQKIGDDSDRATILSKLGTVHKDNGNLRKALNYYQEDYEVFEVAGDKFQSGSKKINIKKLDFLTQQST